MDKKKLVNEIIAQCERDGEPVSRVEAIEMAEMEMKSKKYCKHYETDKTTRKTSLREKKIDKEKTEIIKFIFDFLKRYKKIIKKEKLLITNPQQEITFSIGENNYSIKLIKHRNKK